MSIEAVPGQGGHPTPTPPALAGFSPIFLALGLAPLPLASDPLWARAALGLLAVLGFYLYARQALGPGATAWSLRPAHLWAAGYFVLTVASPLWSVRPDASFALLPAFAAAAAAFWLLSQVGEAELWQTVLLLVGAATLQALFDLALMLFSSSSLPLAGTVGYRGAFAALLLAGALAAAAAALAGPWSRRRLLWLAGVLCLGVALASGSRLIRLLTLPALLALVALWPATMRRRAALELTFASLAALLLAALLLVAGHRTGPPPSWLGSLIPTAGEASLSARLDAWRAALHMLVQRPIFGAGTMGFSRLYGLYQQDWRQWLVDAHSTWLQTAADLGLGGILCLLAAWATVTVGALRHFRKATPLLLALAVPAAILVLHGSADLDYDLPAMTVWTWALVGGTLAAASPLRAPGPRFGTLARHAWLWRGVLLPLGALGVAVVLLSPAIADGYVQTARQRLAGGDAPGAIVASESANWWRPTAAAWAWEGAALTRLAEARGGDPFRRQALSAVTKAVARDPYNPALRSQLAVLQEGLGQRQAALDSLNAAVQAMPYHPRFRVELAEAAARRGDASAAQSMLATLLSHWEQYASLAGDRQAGAGPEDWYRRIRLDQAQIALATGERALAHTALLDLVARYPGDSTVAALRQDLGK